MTPRDAANQLRPSFKLEAMPPEDRHHVQFVQAVAAELDIEPTAFNLHQLADALDAANIHADSNEFPKMFYSRTFPTEGDVPGVYDRRNDWVSAVIATDDQLHALGDGWVDDPANLPARGSLPLYPPGKPIVTHKTGMEPAHVGVEAGKVISEGVA